MPAPGQSNSSQGSEGRSSPPLADPFASRTTAPAGPNMAEDNPVVNCPPPASLNGYRPNPDQFVLPNGARPRP